MLCDGDFASNPLWYRKAVESYQKRNSDRNNKRAISLERKLRYEAGGRKGYVKIGTQQEKLPSKWIDAVDLITLAMPPAALSTMFSSTLCPDPHYGYGYNPHKPKVGHYNSSLIYVPSRSTFGWSFGE